MKVLSILRDGQYNKLRTIVIDGLILDLGGSNDSEYHSLIKGTHSFTVVNINPKHCCDLLFDIQNPFPIEDNKFDAVLSMNVLEHVYEFNNVIIETFRVLKKGGNFIFSVPFMHHIHGNPDDYFRYSRSAIEKMLSIKGFHDICVEEIGEGVFSLFYQSIAGFFPPFLRPLFKNTFLLFDRFFSLFSKRYVAAAKRVPLGYFVMAKK